MQSPSLNASSYSFAAGPLPFLRIFFFPGSGSTLNHSRRISGINNCLCTRSFSALVQRGLTFLCLTQLAIETWTFASPDHYALRKFKYSPLRGGEEVRPSGRERGFNELSFLKEKTFMMDTHGATSHLNALQVPDIENFLLSIE